MSIRDSLIYVNDVAEAAKNVNDDFLKDKSLLVTGATGLIGSAIVDIILYLNANYGTNTTIFAAGRSNQENIDRFPDGKEKGLVSVLYEATKPVDFKVKADYIIHCASNASPDKYIEEPVDTMLANVFGIHSLLEYAVQNNVKKVLYVSSSEVYGKLGHGRPMVEDEYGDIDILSVRSSYSMGKRAAETMCICYAKQHNTQVSIVRPGHIYGPTALQFDKRISSDFAFKAARGENLVMKSAGTQIRSYCHCLDCATAMLKVLEKGENGQAYNISNKKSVVTIRQMAELMAQSGRVELVLDVPSDKEMIAFNPMDNSSLNAEKLEKLGWSGLFDSEKGIQHTIASLQEIM